LEANRNGQNKVDFNQQGSEVCGQEGGEVQSEHCDWQKWILNKKLWP